LLLLLKIFDLKRITFITIKNKTRIIKVKAGFTGANVAKSIMGKPKTMAGKF
jgi:hypothetical protein